MFHPFVFCLIAAVHFFQPVPVKSIRADKNHSFVSYHMVHPLHEWTGYNRSIEGILQVDSTSGRPLKVAILAKISGFDSKNSNRDSHMMEVTEALQYPTISFVSSLIEEKGNLLEVKGTIQFHGISKEVSFSAMETREKKNLKVSGRFNILLEDFKIEKPSLMMVEVDNKVTIEFEVNFPQ